MTQQPEHFDFSNLFQFITHFMVLQKKAHETAVEKGWWDDPPEDGTIVALLHSEASELLEALRTHNPPSPKIPEFSLAEEECADMVIRLMDTCEKKNWRLASAIVAKMQYNKTRPYKHGGKAF